MNPADLERAPRPAPSRRVDASMDLLNSVIANPIDPDYARVAAQRRPSLSRWRLAVAAVAVGAMFALAAAHTNQRGPAETAERALLAEQVQAAQRRNAGLRGSIEAERSRVRDLRAAAGAGDDETRRLNDQLETVGAIVGAGAVTGPGLVVVVDDADGGRGRVIDRDLQQLVNALLQLGAEAVAVNGHRISTLTAIRGAGDSITVDYRSLVRPYRVEAIGDPRTLSTRLAGTSGGALWGQLHQRYGLRFDVTESTGLRLSADPVMTLHTARRIP